MARVAYDLGPMVGNKWHQWSDASGLVYYGNLVTRVSTYQLPAGWEDDVDDVWEFDPTKAWPQWNNQRTGRSSLRDPKPRPPNTFLEDPHVAARISVLRRTPDSPAHSYRQMMSAILQWLFTPSRGYSVLQASMADDLRPDFAVLKLLTKPGGSPNEFVFLQGKTKVPGSPWAPFADNIHTVLSNNDNDTKNVYGMLQIGFEVQFYRHRSYVFEPLGGRMHLVNDAPLVIAWARYLKAKPMPFVN